jgi:peptidoglycan L-alanyl-D-glutamate endopeptidase CwlK
MASRLLRDCDTRVAQAYSNAAKDWNEKYSHLGRPIITCTYRPPIEQDRLYSIGRTKPGKIITNARRYQSPHNYYPSLALDFAITDTNNRVVWKESLFILFGELCEKYGVNWGGRWKKPDYPHIQIAGFDWRDWLNSISEKKS